ncbi:NifU family protein [Pasteuria penetrans]|uniref:NifU family protein n=1 Tax=Pasteuria penetrans TaxID=86005 RepID=UPI0011EC28EC|nr:NifU family protein [Pasteuria penetrans]
MNTGTCDVEPGGEETIEDRVEKCIDKLRPYIQSHGGDVKLVNVCLEEGIVEVILLGVCGSCPSSTITLKAGIENALKEDIPEIKEVRQV